MGSCFSTTTAATATGPDSAFLPTTTAKVITLSGILTEYSSPIRSSLVLGDQAASFLCDSDRLYYGERAPAMGPADPVLPGRLYFVLPAQRLERTLTGEDMAALAVRATAALAAGGKKRSGRGKKGVRVMPVVEDSDARDGDCGAFGNRKVATKMGGGSRMVVGVRMSFKKGKLSTIEEEAAAELSCISSY